MQIIFIRWLHQFKICWNIKTKLWKSKVRVLIFRKWNLIQLKDSLENLKLFTWNAFMALRAHLLFKLWICSLCVHLKTKTKKSSRILWKKVVDFENLLEIKFCSQISLKKVRGFFCNLYINLACLFVMQ